MREITVKLLSRRGGSVLGLEVLRMGWCQPTFLVAFYLKWMILPTMGLGLDWARDGVGGRGTLCPGSKNSTSQSFFMNSCNGSSHSASGGVTKVSQFTKEKEREKEKKQASKHSSTCFCVRTSVDPVWKVSCGWMTNWLPAHHAGVPWLLLEPSDSIPRKQAHPQSSLLQSMDSD